MSTQNKTASLAESALTELVKQLAIDTGETSYVTARLAVNVNGKVEWETYTPSAGWTEACDYAAAASKLIAATLRRKAADLLAQADTMEAAQFQSLYEATENQTKTE